jgi:alpha-ketoglutaric semialdehyde dehydrogenase
MLERKAGRIVANGFPTGIEVSDTLVHGMLSKYPGRSDARQLINVD